MMSRKKQKQPPTQRSPHIVRQKQSTFHYSSNRSQTERPRPRENSADARQHIARVTKFMRRFAQLQYIFGILLFVSIVFYLSLLTGEPKIVIKGNQQNVVRSTAAYSGKAQELMNTASNKSKLLVNRQTISDDLTKAFPEIQSARVITPLFGQRATIQLELSKPQVLLNSGTNTYVLDSRGIAVIEITKNNGTFKTDGLPLIADESNAPITIGKPALTSVQTAFLAELAHQSAAKQLTVESMSMTAGGGELNVRYVGTPYLIKFNLNEDARKSFGTYIATKEYLDKTKTKPTEYIDVRIPERAYVK